MVWLKFSCDTVMCTCDTNPHLSYHCFPSHRAPSITNHPSQCSQLLLDTKPPKHCTAHKARARAKPDFSPPPALKPLFIWNEGTYVVFPWCLRLTSWFSFSAYPPLSRRCRHRCRRLGQGWGQWQSGCKSVRHTRDLSTCSAVTDLQLKPTTALQRSPRTVLQQVWGGN